MVHHAVLTVFFVVRSGSCRVHYTIIILITIYSFLPYFSYCVYNAILSIKHAMCMCLYHVTVDARRGLSYYILVSSG